MPEVAVSKKSAEPAPARPTEPSRSLWPFGRNLSPFSLSPFSMMRELTDEMNQMFRGISTGTEIQAWTPAMDVQRCNGSLVVSAELPGLKREEVKVEVSEDSLVIEGERKREHREDHDGYHRWERNYGHFYRSVPLPEGAKTDQVKAELKDGVLKVTVPVPEVARKTRQVPVAG